MITLKYLDVKQLPEVFKWTEDYPWPAEVGYEEWKEQMFKRIGIALLDDEDLIAAFSLEPLAPGVFELHLDVKRGTNTDALIVAGLSIKKQLFEGDVNLIVGWTPAANKAVIRVAKDCGFEPDGVEMFKGKVRWSRLSITREQYEQQKQTESDYDAAGYPEHELQSITG